ncbi:hypothetical protein T484DRAFT_1765519 [Baffinella frigidus]|nr:hypothetical protein T484DRAFT_1765519 [Cryptophyta sp. CCMP2293]
MATFLSAATPVVDSCWLVEKPSDDFLCQEGKLVRCRPLENLVGMLQTRCANAVLDASELPTPAKRAKTEAHEKMTAAQLRKKLVQEHGLKIAPGATRKEDFLALLKQHHASGCGWVGAISGLSSHLAADCLLETVPCSNAGCSATLQRRDLENHGMYCDFRQVPCRFSCGATLALASRTSHESMCMKATGFFCSGTTSTHGGGCKLTGTREEMIKHQENCPDIEIACDSPGCTTTCKRSAMRAHMEEACETHVDVAKKHVEATEKTIAEQKKKITELTSSLATRASTTVAEQKKMITELTSYLVTRDAAVAEQTITIARLREQLADAMDYGQY